MRRRGKPTVRRSGFEDRIEAQLKKNKTKYKYEPYGLQYKVPERSAKYFPDFEITTRSGKTILIESKGRLTSQDRKKMLLVMEANPEVDLRMVFMRDNYIRKGSKTKYSDWATKNNIPFAIGEIPREWLS